MAWGEQIDWLEDLAREEGQLPKALADRPTLREDLEFEWRAFWSLSSSRSSGPHGVIPFAAMDRYAERYGIVDVDRFERFQELMVAMSAALNKEIDERSRSGSTEQIGLQQSRPTHSVPVVDGVVQV